MPQSWKPSTDHAEAVDCFIANKKPKVPENQKMSDSCQAQSSADLQRDPTALAIRAHLLGLVLGVSILTSTYLLILTDSAQWRLAGFLGTLCTFHSLEYYITARFNPSEATVSAFLLNNGRAYNIAHLCAFAEASIRMNFLPTWQVTADTAPGLLWLLLGIFMVLSGQAVRSTGMAHAGSNFNHIVQARRKVEHTLVTDGIYAHLRHPSYFGFFWWGIGSQIVLGNWICLAGYALVLHRFFRLRIEREEAFLTDFFGDEYIRYKRSTPVRIPFIE